MGGAVTGPFTGQPRGRISIPGKLSVWLDSENRPSCYPVGTGAIAYEGKRVELQVGHLTPWPFVRKRTIPTERPSIVGEI
jgi:hypothetical protein